MSDPSLDPIYGYYFGDNEPLRKRCPECGSWMHQQGSTQEWTCSGCGHEQWGGWRERNRDGQR